MLIDYDYDSAAAPTTVLTKKTTFCYRLFYTINNETWRISFEFEFSLP